MEFRQLTWIENNTSVQFSHETFNLKYLSLNLKSKCQTLLGKLNILIPEQKHDLH